MEDYGGPKLAEYERSLLRYKWFHRHQQSKGKGSEFIGKASILHLTHSSTL